MNLYLYTHNAINPLNFELNPAMGKVIKILCCLFGGWGEAISGAPSINGTNQFPNQTIMIGITIKKIITKAWAETLRLITPNNANCWHY